MEKRLTQIPLGLAKVDLGRKFEEKSNKSQRRMINKTVKKINLMEKKLDQTKKEYRKIIEKIIEQYENKLKKVEN